MDLQFQQPGEYFGWPQVQQQQQQQFQYTSNNNNLHQPLKYAKNSRNKALNGISKEQAPSLRPIGVNKVAYHQQQPVPPKYESLIDLTKLKVASLRRYVKYFDLDNVASNTPKNQLVKIVSEHWKKLKFDEELEKQTVLDFTLKYKQEKVQAKGSRRLRQQTCRRDFIDDEDYEL